MFRTLYFAFALFASVTTLHAQTGQGNNSGPEASKAEKAASPTGKLNFQTDLFTGRFGYSVPIQVAPGRNGSEPQIGLRYNSASDDGWCGHGWDLDLGYIQRETKRGVPVKWGPVYPLREYDNAKGFVFSLGGQSAALVNVGTNEYRAEIEAGFLRFTLITNVGGTTTNYWQVIDKGGNKYFFGRTSNSRMANNKAGWPSNSAAGTFRWALNLIETATGDTTAMTYTNITGAQYPLVLAYNGHTSGLTNSHTVEFQVGDRTDKRIAYNSGYRVETSKRLTNILAKVSGRLVRRYLLGYTNSPSTTRSLIRSVTMFGTNSTDSLPPLTFNYSVQPFQFEPETAWTGLLIPFGDTAYCPPFNSFAGRLFADLVDMDGDGLPERLLTSTNFAGPFTNFVVQHNNGVGFDTARKVGPLQSQGQTFDANWSVINSQYSRLLDINGDGFPDRVMDNYASFVLPPNNNYTNLVIEYNTGAGFTADTQWTNIMPKVSTGTPGLPFIFAIENSSVVKMVDMNGDSLPDRLTIGWQIQGTTPFTNYIIQFNTGSGFGSTNYFGPYYSQNQWTNQGSDFTGLDSYVLRLLDINGDGLPDRVMGPFDVQVGTGMYLDQRFTNFVVEFNNGYGFEPGLNWGGVDPQYNQPATVHWAATTTSEYCSVQDTGSALLRDINGDGLPDRIMRGWLDSRTNWLVQINTGSGFAAVKAFGPNFSQGNNFDEVTTLIESPFNTLLDLNGDGLPDRVMMKVNPLATDTYFVVQMNKGPFPDLLTTVSNGIGGTVTASYTPSTQYDNRESTASSDGKRLLPFPLQTVSSVSVSDGFYPSNKTTYSYEGGMWSPSRREFHGFARVQATDPLGLSTVQWFHQAGGRDNSSIGEYLDTTNAIAKKGIPFRTETLGSDGQLYKLSLSKVEDADLGSGRHFASVPQTIEIDYVGATSGNRASAQGFRYDLATGNLLTTTNYGEVTVTSIPAHTITDIGTDVFYQSTAYATLANTNIIDKPQSVTLTADVAGSSILRESLFDYDGTAGNLTRQRDRICAGSYRTTGFGYDAYNNRSAETNAAGIVTQTVYDSAYRIYPIQQTTSGSYVSSAIFDPLSGSLISSTDIKGLVTSNALDSLRRLTNTSISTTPGGAASLWVARHEYILRGVGGGNSTNYIRVRKNDGVDSANGHETWTYSDGLGRAIQTRVEAETNGYRAADVVYDPRGNLRLETQPYFSSGTNFAKPTGAKDGTARNYDPVGRLGVVTPNVTATFSSGGLLQTTAATGGDSGSPVGPTITAYNDGVNPWAIVRTDEETKVRKFLLDAFGGTNQIIEVTGAGNYTTTLAHDKVGTLTNITDHAGNVIEFSHNDLGELIAMADPDMGVWEYRRDVAGRIREQVDAKTNLIRFDYTDPLGRPKTRLAYNPQGAFVQGVTNVYDSSDDGAFTVYSGQLYKVSDSQGFEKHSFDVRGRSLKTARFLAKNGQTYTTQSTFDDANRPTSVIYPNSGPTLTNLYDTGGNLSQVKRVGGANTVFFAARGFNSLGQTLGANFGNGIVTTNDYFANTKRLRKTATFKTGGTNIQDLSYLYDKVSNIKGIADGVYSGSASATLTNILYDDLHRLTSLTHPTQGTKTYTINPIGNIIANGELGADTYGYGVRMPHAVKTVGSIRSYGHDANGNMISRYGQKLDYDSENRLARLTTLTQTNTFGYAGDGERLWKQGAGGVQVWIGGIYEEKQGKVLFHVLAGGQKVCTFDAIGTNVFEYYHADHLHSTSVLTDTNGIRIQHHEYSAYGRDRYTESSTAFSLSHRFTGQILDEDTGLYYYGARYYDPELARFIQPDNIIPDFSDPQSYNRYSYVRNNPLKRTDPNGHSDFNVVSQVTAPAGSSFSPSGGVFSYQPQQTAVAINFAQAVASMPVGPSISQGNPYAPQYIQSQPINPFTHDALLMGAPHLIGTPMGQRLAGMNAEAILTAPGAELAAMKIGAAFRFIRGGAEESIVSATARGRASEARVLNELGHSKNTEKVFGREGASIPDFQNKRVVGEIKDVKRVTDSPQLRIQKEAANNSGRTHELHTGVRTTVTPSAASGTTVIRRPDLGPPQE